jgi:histidine triad (HIT) family protein
MSGDESCFDENCIFCRIIQRRISSKIVHEDAYSIAFEDIKPQSPVHILVIPKKHIPGIQGMTVSI